MTSSAIDTTPAEGAIQFRYRLRACTEGERIVDAAFAQLSAWRTILKQLKLLGRDARRYDGFGYGNLSARDGATNRFFVTASQTSGAPRLRVEDLVRVDR